MRFWTWEAKSMGKIMGRDGGRRGEERSYSQAELWVS